MAGISRKLITSIPILLTLNFQQLNAQTVAWPSCAQPIWGSYTQYSVCNSYVEIYRTICLCSDVNFLTGAARAVYNTCGEDDLRNTAEACDTTCQNNGAQMALTIDELVRRGEGSSSTTTSKSTTLKTSTTTSKSTASTTSTSTPTSGASRDTEEDDKGGFTTDQKIALGCGLGIGLPAALCSLWMCLCGPCRRGGN